MLRDDFKQKYITLDFETEDLNLVKTKPWQVSWIVSTLNGTTEEHDYFLKWPDLNMSKSARDITKFSDEKYERLAVNPTEVLDKLDALIYDPNVIVIGQNILGFDIFVHNVLRNLCGYRTDYSYLPRVVDTKCLSKAKNLGIAYNGDSRILWQYRVDSIRKKAGKNSQAALLKSLEIDHDPERLHDSLYDVQMTFEIFKKLIWSVEVC